MTSEMNDLLRMRVTALDNELQATRVKLIDSTRELNRALYKLDALRDEKELYISN